MNRHFASTPLAALALGCLAFFSGTSQAGPPGEVRFVNSIAAPGGDGASWESAFDNLQDALTAAIADRAVESIWVAAGTYVPSAPIDPKNPRTATFNIPANLKLYGGFAGDESLISQRDIAATPTILTGDLAGDDGPNFAARDENAYHVLLVETDNVTIDGFIVEGGNANGDSITDSGGGGLSVAALNTPTRLSRCTFRGNQAKQGGAIISMSRFFEIANCVFTRNRAVDDQSGFGTGGAIVTFTGGFPVAFTAVNCAFIGNHASGTGGAAAGFYTGFHLINCTVVGNTSDATFGGGGAVAQGPGSNLVLDNCILFGNQAADAASPQLHQFWGPGAPDLTIINNCCIQDWSGSFGGIGNFDADPLFADAAGADEVVGTQDDDLRLSEASPCIDAGNLAALPADLADVDGDANFAEPIPVDLGGLARVAGATIDIGAHEFHAVCPADIAPGVGNGMVGAEDLLALLSAWGTCIDPAACPEDISGDDAVGSDDLLVLLSDWGQCG